ncbi:hypothetical protein INR49_010090 [Caranx melampygus]|nr:hypothetical protein INR49_010090 [Caranx melampygus]
MLCVCVCVCVVSMGSSSSVTTTCPSRLHEASKERNSQMEIKVGGQPGGHGLFREGRRTGHPEPNRGPERREGGGASLEEERSSEVQPAQPQLCCPTHLHPQDAALVSWRRVQERSPEADREAGAGGRDVPHQRESAACTVLRPDSVLPVEDQTLPGDSLRGWGQEVLHHG